VTPTLEERKAAQREAFVGLLEDVFGGPIDDIKARMSPEVMDQVRQVLATRHGDDGATNRLRSLTGAGVSTPEERKRMGLGAARVIRALAAGKGDATRAARYAKNQWNDDDVVKALESGTDSAGGFLVPTNYSDEIIELLYPATVIRGFGATVVPMDNGNMTWPRLAAGVGAEYVGENQNIVTDQPVFGDLSLSWKKLAVNVPISNDLIRFSSPKADVVVRNDVVEQMSVREDIGFIRDDGTGQKPTGLRHQPGVTVLAATDISAMDVSTGAGRTARNDAIQGDLDDMVLTLEESNVPITNAGYILTPRAKHFLMRLTDINGNKIYPEMRQGQLNGYPFRTTTQIPVNLGAGSDESEIYFANFPDILIGESSNLVIDVSTEAAYYDGSAVQSAWSRDQTVMRAIARHDLGLRRTQSVVVLTEVAWNP
jgi:HK97 family phage major capsid protein